MKVIVTGGCGFIGSHLTELLLNKGHTVTVLDNMSTGRPENLAHLAGRAGLEIIECDLSAKGEWIHTFQDTDWVAHLASLADIVPSIQTPVAYFNSNVTSTLNILEASKQCKIKRFAYAASSSCYGLPDGYPTAENADIRPMYPYALTKRMGEELVLHWSALYKIPAVSLRFFNVYGIRSRTSGTYGAMFGVFLAQKIAGKPYTVVGSGEQTRDFTYVSDVADAVYTALESDRSGEIYNVGSGATVSVNRITELLGGSRVHIPKRPGEPDCTFADISKIKADLNWSPQISIEDGVEIVLDHIDYWREAPVWDPDSIAVETKDWFKYLK